MWSIRSLLIMLALLPATTVLAQGLKIEPAAQAAKELRGQLQGIDNNGVVYTPPSTLDLDLMCAIGSNANGSTPYGYIDTNHNGHVNMIRVYGTDMVTAKQWAQAGIQLLAPMRNRAILMAQGLMAQAIKVNVLVADGKLDHYAADLNSVNISKTDDKAVTSTADAMLRDAMVTGMKIVSLGPKQGICVVVRYDAPLAANHFQVHPTEPRKSSGASQSGSRSPGYQVPPAGSASSY